ncbi:MAG: rRNA pseudouridine synthase [Dysgonamonadaceae bacterium]|jgi:23S rRNA pseudouridine2605 synthase|nr:rRNA pseudouridine synthase [Dysgonamonadaceae bacterium]
MITEKEEWAPRKNYSEEGENGNGQKTRRPYQPNNRGNYGNNRNSESSYGHQEGSYERPKTIFNRPQTGGYGNRQDNNERQGGYSSQRHSQYDSQNLYERPHGNRQEGNDSEDFAKKRRPRVGEAPAQNRKNYGNHPQTGNNRFNQGGGYQQRQHGTSSRQQGGFKKFDRTQQTASHSKTSKYREESFNPNEEIRINKFLANAGLCSRREADEYIKAGVVKINGVVVAELGSKVKRTDEVYFHNEPVRLEHKIYVLLNKPRNCVTTSDDPQERLTVMDMVKTACQERIFPVGRLDRNTTGVLLLTNDGDLSSRLTHPKFLKKKIYHVWLDKPVTVEDMQKIAAGIELEDGEIHADAISYVNDEDKDQVGIEIHSGRNRIVRRMFELLGYHVVKLDRVYFAGLTKKNLKRGQWRFLSEKEVNLLRMGAFD